MSKKYKVRGQDHPYFITITVVKWIDVFTRARYMELLIESLAYCQRKKGLTIHAWVFMTNHLHLIIDSNTKPLQGIVRDFKRHTSTVLKHELYNAAFESRKEWMLRMFKTSGLNRSNTNDWQFWQHGFHPIELSTAAICDQKLHYLHHNPVKAGFVRNPEDYVWSSAIDYVGGKGDLEVVLL